MCKKVGELQYMHQKQVILVQNFPNTIEQTKLNTILWTQLAKNYWIPASAPTIRKASDPHILATDSQRQLPSISAPDFESTNP